jgi:hypothetical protein
MDANAVRAKTPSNVSRKRRGGADSRTLGTAAFVEVPGGLASLL